MMPKRNGNGEIILGRPRQLLAWITLIAVIAGVGGYVAKGTASQEMLDYRLTQIENGYVSQEALDLNLKNIDDRLIRIEGKLDSQIKKQGEINTKLDNLIDEEDMKSLIEAYIETQK